MSLGESAKILFYKKQRGGENLLCLFKTDQALLTKRWYSTKRSTAQMKGKAHKYFFLAAAEVKMVSIYLSSVLILKFRPSTS